MGHSGLARLTACLLLTAAAGCAPVRVDFYVPPGEASAPRRTFQWAAAGELSTGDARLDNNWFFDERVRAAVARELGSRGIEAAHDGRADVVVHYHATVAQAVELKGIDEEYKYCREAGCGPVVYEAGTLLIDIEDAASHRLVWRGWAESVLDGVIDDQPAMEQRVDRIVREIFRRLPPAF